MASLTGWLPFLAGAPLLAADNRGFGRRSQNFEAGTDVIGLLIVLAAMLLLACLAWGFSYWQKRRALRVMDSPRALFKELCAAHGLHRADRELLYEIAQWHAVADPVQLFFEPQRFQPKEMHEALDCELEAEELQTRLFAVESAEAKAASPSQAAT